MSAASFTRLVSSGCAARFEEPMNTTCVLPKTESGRLLRSALRLTMKPSGRQSDFTFAMSSRVRNMLIWWTSQPLPDANDLMPANILASLILFAEFT